MGVSACDIACGMAAHANVLEALIARGITGQGKGIKVSLFDGMADWMNVPLLFFEGTGKAPERMGLAHPSICPYGAFPTADGALVLGVYDERRLRFAGSVGKAMGESDFGVELHVRFPDKAPRQGQAKRSPVGKKTPALDRCPR